MQKKLSAILPEAKFWFKGEEKPDAGLSWIVSIFDYELMAPATTSVALLQEDELLLGILGNFTQLEMIAGERGGGAWMESEEFKVGKNELSDKSSNMQFFPGKGTMDSTQKSLLNTFRKKFNIQSRVNRVEQCISYNMSLVARGAMDFSLGLNFSYPDIAAVVCIVEQAGGVVSDFSGGKSKLFAGEEYFCSNPIIHSQFIELANGISNQENKK